ncbi:MAG: GntR family transcriptional regulator [Actinomycetes bacterium]
MSEVAELVAVDRGSPVPLYFQVAQALQHHIETGAIPAGSLLGNEIRIADELGISRPTVRKAIEYLVRRGLLVRKRGVGTQVVRAQVRRPLELTSLNDDLASAGRRPATRVLALEVVPAGDDVAAELGTLAGADVVHLRRLRLADDEPIAVLSNYLPVGLVQLDAEVLEHRGLYEVLRSAGVHIHVADQSIGAKSASETEAALLDEPPGAALLTMTRTAYDDSGQAVEFGNHVYRASRYSFSLTLLEH